MLFVDLGPLHIAINQGGDVADNWHFLIDKIYTKMTRKHLKKDRVPLREQMAYLECINGAWLFLKNLMGPALLKKRSISSTAFYWLLNNTIPSALLHYSVVFKDPSSGKAYYDALPFAYIEFACKNRKNYKRALLHKLDKYVKLTKLDHPLLKIIRDKCSYCDEATNEGGIIGRLATVMKQSQNINVSINKAYRYFAGRMEDNALSIIDNFAQTTSHCSSFFGRKIDVVLSHTTDVIIDICNALLTEHKDEIKFVVEKEKRCCKKITCVCFHSKALTGDDTLQLCTHLHCSPSFSFYPSSPPTSQKCMACHKDITPNNTDFWACGCNFCTDCNVSKCRCHKALQEFITSTQDSMRDVYGRKLKGSELTDDAKGEGREEKAGNNDNEQYIDTDIQDIPVKQMATLKSECEIVIKRDSVYFENIIPEAALPPPASLQQINGKALHNHTKDELKNEINKYSIEKVKTHSSKAIYAMKKEELEELLYKLINDS